MGSDPLFFDKLFGCLFLVRGGRNMAAHATVVLTRWRVQSEGAGFEAL